MKKICETCDIELLAKIHKCIFKEEFPYESYNRKVKTKNMENFLIYDEVLVGYCIVEKQVSELSYYLWLGGVVEEFRNGGNWSFFIEFMINRAKVERFSKITLATYNHRPEMIRLSIKNGFKIARLSEGNYSDGIKIHLDYYVTQGNEIRLLLTNKCNFKCLFCHGEGMEINESLSLDQEQIKMLLTQGQSNGCHTISLSGGEPLINFDGLTKIIETCNQMNYTPSIKIITNGALINNKFIEIIQLYKGNIYINLSVHSLYEDKFDFITKTSNQYPKVMSGIESLVNAEIDFRLNYVVLKEVNDKVDDFKNSLITCINKGVKKITFLELLTDEHNSTLLPYVLDYESIKKILSEVALKLGEIRFQFENENKVRYLFVFNNQHLFIEVFRLTCSIGCEKCLNIKDRTIGPDGKYYPCFRESGYSCGNVKSDMKTAFSLGNQFIISKINERTGALMNEI